MTAALICISLVAPIVVGLAGAFVAVFVSRRRWLVHVATMLAIVLAGFIGLYVIAAVDDYHPGDAAISVAAVLVGVLVLSATCAILSYFLFAMWDWARFFRGPTLT